ncbi:MULTISPECIES: hypothetical protein [unclassified Streptomyces]|uniref:hypothetical protein n=1 Tax=unclassified Streptomyces TaxID=2593676 RepID=UPI0011C92CB9|nr:MULTISPECIES: hypothetical protein [unclassified Streptomyces]TXS18026.1 hypothetical protein EAO68_10080 [Streptomyces sp. wa22]WSQ84975.1 hypothetical protein OG722_11695 [Streptomyces sp. NBC_01212]
MNTVHQLLERAVESAGSPAVSTEAVHARAARVRFRRRAAVSVAALAVVATGAVTLPGVVGGEQHEQTSVAAAPPVARADGSGKADRLAALLPPDVGSVERVSLAVLIKGATPEQARTAYTGPLDGEYMVRKDGGTGYLVLSFMDHTAVSKKFGAGAGPDNLCETRGNEPPVTDCVREEQPDGSVLTTWSDSMDHGYGGTPEWGREVVGRLVLKDGSMLAARSSTGYLGERSQGPLLKTPPVGQEELGTLLTRPGLLPRK